MWVSVRLNRLGFYSQAKLLHVSTVSFTSSEVDHSHRCCSCDIPVFVITLHQYQYVDLDSRVCKVGIGMSGVWFDVDLARLPKLS